MIYLPTGDPGARPTIQEIEAEVVRLGTEYPDTVYENPESSPGDSTGKCFYTKGLAGPGVGCIFGQALKNLGVSEEYLANFEGVSIHGVVRWEQTPSVWETVQKNQDRQFPWGKIIKPIKDPV